jgi:hypothetical protein
MEISGDFVGYFTVRVLSLIIMLMLLYPALRVSDGKVTNLLSIVDQLRLPIFSRVPSIKL